MKCKLLSKSYPFIKEQGRCCDEHRETLHFQFQQNLGPLSLVGCPFISSLPHQYHCPAQLPSFLGVRQTAVATSNSFLYWTPINPFSPRPKWVLQNSVWMMSSLIENPAFFLHRIKSKLFTATLKNPYASSPHLSCPHPQVHLEVFGDISGCRRHGGGWALLARGLQGCIGPSHTTKGSQRTSMGLRNEKAWLDITSSERSDITSSLTISTCNFSLFFFTFTSVMKLLWVA